MKHIAFTLVTLALSVTGSAQSTIDHTVCVAAYNCTCHTTDKDGQPSDVKYRLALQVGKKVSCSMGYAQHSDSLQKEKAEEARRYIPRTYHNWPEGKLTAHEVMPFDRFITTEAMGMKWRLADERDSILHLPCQKAIGNYHGRTWTAWFTPDIPSSAGPWRLHGLPGLILKAESDGVYEFECSQIDFVKEPIVMMPHDGVKAPHAKFVKHRNKKLCGDISLDNLIPVSQVNNVVVMHGNVSINGIPLIDTDTQYQPLEIK